MDAVSSQNQRGRPAERGLDAPYFPDKWNGARANFVQSVVRESGRRSGEAFEVLIDLLYGERPSADLGQARRENPRPHILAGQRVCVVDTSLLLEKLAKFLDILAARAGDPAFFLGAQQLLCIRSDGNGRSVDLADEVLTHRPAVDQRKRSDILDDV